MVKLQSMALGRFNDLTSNIRKDQRPIIFLVTDFMIRPKISNTETGPFSLPQGFLEYSANLSEIFR
jgi:hypothetical protein